MTSRYVPVAGDFVVTQEDGYVYLNPRDVFTRKYSLAPAADGSIEAEIVAKGKTAPRVTPDDIEANIAAEHFFTAAHGVEGAVARGECWAKAKEVDTLAGEQAVVPPLHLLTFCVLTLRNGFTVTGESACASPENFDAEIGRKIARQNAVQKIWPLMGYALRSQLANA
ncbi:MAG: hypothetical protein I8N66_27295 [Ensifer sp. SSB1]|nr:hypothetical protein [Ensifer sp. SSB1]